MIVDSHCHLDRLDLTPYDGDLNKALDAALKNDVKQLLCVCIDLENFPNVLEIADAYPFIYASVGVHPNHECEAEPDEATLIRLAGQAKVIAIGETGLDYYRSAGDLDWQRDRFRTHIRAANAVNKPLIIHSRQAREDTLTIMREENAANISGVMHCFTETWDMAKAAMDLNFYISLSGIVTFKNAKDLQDVAKKIPLDRLLIETDSPYLAPMPHRGKPNEPAYVRHVAEFLAALRGEPYETLAAQTTENFNRLFLSNRC